MNHPEPHDLTALAYNMVEGPERQMLLEHVSQCDACRELYDSYLEEQALVRDVLYRDARSGPAEARALEKTLAALNALGEPAAPQPAAPAGRLFSLVTWKLVAQVAAVLVIALGLLVILKPPAKDAPETIAIAPQDQAPGRVVSGELLVPASGQWQRADAVPVNEWVMAGDAPLELAFPGGASASLQPSAVFRIAREEGESRPVLYLLHGSGVYAAGNEPDMYCVRWRDGEFVPMAGAQVSFDASYAENWQPDAQNVRGWVAARHMNVRVTDGKGVFLPSRGGTLPGVLVAGEGLEQGPDRARVLRSEHGAMELLIELETESADAARKADFLRLRLGDIRTGNAELDKDLRLRIERAQQGAKAGAQTVFVRAVATDGQRKATRRASVRSAEDGLQLLVENSDGHWSVEVLRDTGGEVPEFTSHNGADVNALRKALSEDARRLFDEAIASLK